jgi:FkbM family methyltransferase
VALAAAVRRRARRAGRALRSAGRRLRKRARRLQRRARAAAQRWRVRSAREASLRGLRIALPRGLPLPLREAIHAGAYEAPELALVDAYLEPGDRVLEIGGGLGAVAAFCARRVGSENVVSCEPNPALRRAALATFRRNGLWPELVPALVGARAGRAVLHVRRDPCTSSLLPDGESTPLGVEMRAFGDELRRCDPSFVVMDAEGGEHELVRGADWGGVRKLVVELHPSRLGAERLAEVHDALVRAGFVAQDAQGDVVYFTRLPTDPARESGSRADRA